MTAVLKQQTLDLAHSVTLAQNHPNPFNATTTVRFSLAQEATIRLEVLNLLGQRIWTLAAGYFPAGNHTVTWDGRANDGTVAGSGVYIYSLRTEDSIQKRKMLLSR